MNAIFEKIKSVVLTEQQFAEELLNEAKFKSEEIEKHSYLKDVIDKLIHSEEGVKTGEKGEGVVLYADDYNVDALEELANSTEPVTAEQFNACIDPESPNAKAARWTNIFKGDFSGYVAGAEVSKNKGNAFETYFLKEIQQYIVAGEATANVKRLMKLIGPNIVDVKADGALNQKRPIQFNNGTITCGNTTKDFNIGSTVTDITVLTNNKGKKKKEYLSLKYGSSVTFVNAGISKFLTKEEIAKSHIVNEKGKLLLDLFEINDKEFCDAFNNYSRKPTDKKSKSSKKMVNITKKLNGDPKFETFIKSVIGYGYILVHQIGKEVHFVDMRNENVLNNMIDVKSAVILYPEDGGAKRVDVEIDMEGISLKINFRNKSGGIYPSHIMCDYKLNHEALPEV